MIIVFNWITIYLYRKQNNMKKIQKRGSKFTHKEIAYVKHLLKDRFLNDTQVSRKVEEVVGKTIDRKHVNSIRHNKRWGWVIPSDSMSFD